MGLDPKTHSPASPFSAPPTAAADPSSFPSTRHMAQWESARLEAEARLSRESMLFSFCNNENYPQPSDPSDKPGVDVFLRIWNSEIGESFRSKKGGFVKVETEESLNRLPLLLRRLSMARLSLPPPLPMLPCFRLWVVRILSARARSRVG
ncbi:hypothetical protein QJS10_CPB21g00508 [Acorus calamus]|uniref:Uncharacterized protein n=1 Tax=Acorus calamus TaxID=4465 RepID=A0AAV9C3Y1_ACOCL|nr:hypothetical protein QJS10_CPB21g00508 [Acorus calamus]